MTIDERNRNNLRDQFAMAALPAMIETINNITGRKSAEEYGKLVAAATYAIADAMMKERDKPK